MNLVESMSFRLSRYLRPRYAEWYRGLTPKGGSRGEDGVLGASASPVNIKKYNIIFI